MKTILFIFLDGVGLGEDDPGRNPFALAEMPNLQHLLGGRRMVAEAAPLESQRATLLALDANLGVPGLPQSATGQATLLSGRNIPAKLGYHYGPKPNQAVADLLFNDNLFKKLRNAGLSVAFLNAFPDAYFEAIGSGHRLYGCIALAAVRAGVPLYTVDDLRLGRALSADFTAQGWRDRLGYKDIPLIEPGEAGRRLAEQAKQFEFSLFEYWLTDYAGHEQDMKAAYDLLATFDHVLGGLLEAWDDCSGLVLITSDHGNLEDLSTHRHTSNPVPALLIGAPELRRQFAVGLHDLTGIAPAVERFLLGARTWESPGEQSNEFKVYFSPSMATEHIRNFCIIAHIDHGKSTLADRLLQLTGTISDREMTDQVLDTMDLEREKGVTIKASAVRMKYTARDGNDYELNLIDTPGHVDFGYEVSRALNACEGALLVVDAAQGIEAQTLANLYLALDADLEIIPVINKIDLISARPDEVAEEISSLLGTPAEQILRISAKNGTNIEAVLEAIIQQVPHPRGDENAPLSALIFDSHYDSYKGVVAYVRVMNGEVCATDNLLMMASGAVVKPVEIGIFAPDMRTTQRLSAGEVGYIATGLKTVHECRVGDTVTQATRPAAEPLPGYRKVKPMVFAGVYPVEGEDYANLKDALEKLQLNDASLIYDPETSQALGFGFRCGFLGMFHMEIIQERIEREYDLDVVFTSASVEYEVVMRDGQVRLIDSPADLPEEGEIAEIREPWMKIQIFTPTEFYGVVMETATKHRAIFLDQEYPAPNRVLLNYETPLSELIVNFFDQLKSRTRGYASLDYQFHEYRPENLVKLEILVNDEPVDALATIVHREEAYHRGQAIISKLKDIIPRQLFVVPIQAIAAGRVISRANVKAMRKDVLAKCYGGDISRKKKLLEKQKRGKKRMKMVGSVEIPQEAFLAVLRLDEE